MTLLLRAALCCLAALSLGGCAVLPGFVDRTWADPEPQLIPVKTPQSSRRWAARSRRRAAGLRPL